jgi:hypothetical protein
VATAEDAEQKMAGAVQMAKVANTRAEEAEAGLGAATAAASSTELQAAAAAEAVEAARSDAEVSGTRHIGIRWESVDTQRERERERESSWWCPKAHPMSARPLTPGGRVRWKYVSTREVAAQHANCLNPRALHSCSSGLCR